VSILSDPHLIAVAKVSFPSGTVGWSEPGFGSESGGLYEERILSVGEIQFSRGDARYALETPSVSLVIDDADKSFSNRLGSQEPILNSTVSIYVASKNYAFASWYPAFVGRLASWAKSTRMQYTLTLQPPDLALDAALPRATVDVDWTDADPAVRGALTPLLYGRADSAGATNKGAVPCLYVKSDANPFSYLVQHGWGSNVPRVYQDGARQTVGTYSVTHPMKNGRRYTAVEWTTTRGTSTIAVDAVGCETVGDGTGLAITTPGAVMKHFLTNYVFGNAIDKWLPTSSMIDGASFDAVDTFLAKRANGCSYRTTKYISEQTTARTLLNEWCLSNGVYVMWTGDGKLKATVDDPHTSNLYIDSPWLQHPADELGQEDESGQPDSFRDESNDVDRINRVMVTVGPLPAGGDNIAALEVYDPLGKVEATDDISMTFGPGVLQS
jgi:hypothetical protein